MVTTEEMFHSSHTDEHASVFVTNFLKAFIFINH